MDFKTLAISATLGGTILLCGLTFTGTLNLTDIKNFGADWASKIHRPLKIRRKWPLSFRFSSLTLRHF